MGRSAYWNFGSAGVASRHWATRTAAHVPGHDPRLALGRSAAPTPPSGGPPSFSFALTARLRIIRPVPLQVMLRRFWVASTKPERALGRVRAGQSWRGGASAPSPPDCRPDTGVVWTGEAVAPSSRFA